MSRVEENSHLNFKNCYTTDKNLECAKILFLQDISRSLAVIADEVKKPDEVAEADAYVRDHLLIEWCMENLSIGGNVEDSYEDWIDWLDERKYKNG